MLVELHQGRARAVGRSSPRSLYDAGLASFDMTGYEPKHAEGFIRILGQPLAKAIRAGGAMDG